MDHPPAKSYPAMAQPITFNVMQLPLELVRQIFNQFFKINCPNLFAVKSSGILHAAMEGYRPHKGPTLISITLRREERLILPLLRVSKFFYRITLEYMLGPAVYITGVSGLELQQHRRDMLMRSTMEHRKIELDPEFPFLEFVQTLIIGPRSQRWAEVDSLFPGIDVTAHLLKKILRALGGNSQLRKLVIQGDVFENTFWLMPMPIGTPSPLDNVTHLTLSVPALTSPRDSVLQAHRFLGRPEDAHICLLLTGKGFIDGTTGTVVVPSLRNLEYLHIRGPGAHICSEFFKSEKALKKVIIEIDNHEGFCDSNIGELLLHAEATASNRPQMSISITWEDTIIFKKTPGTLNADGTKNFADIICKSELEKLNYKIQNDRSYAAFTLRATSQWRMTLGRDEIWNAAQEASKLAEDIMEGGKLEFDEAAVELLIKSVDEEWERETSNNVPHVLH